MGAQAEPHSRDVSRSEGEILGLTTKHRMGARRKMDRLGYQLVCIERAAVLVVWLDSRLYSKDLLMD